MTASAFMSEPVYSAEASLDSLTAAPPSRTSQRDIWSSECSYLKQWCGHTLCTSCASGVCIHKRLLGAEPGAAPVLGGNPRNPRGTPGMHRPLPRAGSGAEKWSTLGRPLPRCRNRWVFPSLLGGFSLSRIQVYFACIPMYSGVLLKIHRIFAYSSVFDLALRIVKYFIYILRVFMCI